jgi:SAM-dependent methyltransferase
MGCGTGLVSEAILLRLAENGENLEGTHFSAVDLIGEALEKAAAKYRKLCDIHPHLKEVEDSWISMNLEPDALAGIKDITREAAGGTVIPEKLLDRVKGLKSETIDRIKKLSRQTISDILKGEILPPGVWTSIEEETTPGDTLVLKDLNRGARFVTGRLLEEDLKPSGRQGNGRIPPERLETIRSSDLLLAVLDFGDWDREGKLPIDDAAFDGISASLFLSYLFAPGEAVKEFARMLKPGGRLLISTMKPDSDISGIFTKYIADQSSLDARTAKAEDRERNLREARSMLNEAAALFSLEEDGWFRFFNESELIEMMRNAGFTNIQTIESLGNPAQAIIVTGNKK